MKKRVRQARPRPKQAAHLVELRKRAGLTQTELAEAIDVPQPTIGMWEWSESPPRSEVLPRLAEALGVGVEELLIGMPRKTAVARPRAVGAVQDAFERVRALPRKQQRKVVEMVLALVDRYKGQSA